MKFKDAQDMLDTIVNDCVDLYNPNTNEYVFLYSDFGSIATYWISKEKADELDRDSKEFKDYWSAFLSDGGLIYDNKSHELYREGNITPLEWCEEHWQLEGWIDTRNYTRSVIYGAYAEQHDITFIMRDIINYNNDVKSTEVIGFVYGNEVNNTIAMEKFSGKLKAEFTL